MTYQPKVWIRVAGRWIIGYPNYIQPSLKPILEVELFVCPLGSMDKLALTDCLVTLQEDVDNSIGHFNDSSFA